MDISTKGSVTWSAPSNIALIKYWGKSPGQIPKNPSISLTLDNARSTTTLSWELKDSKGIEFEYFFEDQVNSKFNKRIGSYLNSLLESYPQLENYKLTFSSKNSFPYGAGIASSASAMASVALCLCSMLGIEDFKQASNLARLGSGSASRSLFGGVVSWGKESVEYASPMEGVHPSILKLKDAILIVDSKEKSVSSSQGHQLMNEHSCADQRFDQASERFDLLEKALGEGDIEQINSIVEAEALSIHAMMMTSNPPYVLIRPNTLAIIEKIQQFRQKMKVPVCFTLDAGPNVHLLYFESDSGKVEPWIKSELLNLCENWIEDRVGAGPVRLD